MFDLNAALASWLAATLTAYSLAIWGAVLPLAGGAESPLWRWVLVEQGLFVLGVFVAAWFIRMTLGVGRTPRSAEHWAAAAVFAAGFSFLWGWYNLTVSYAIELGAHPRHGWEWNFFSWGLPLLAAGAVAPGAGFLLKFGLALALGAGALLGLGGLWSALPAPRRARGKAGARARAG